MYRLADSHAHLDDNAFADDRDAVIARAADAGVRTIVVPGVDAASWPRIQALCADYPGLFPAYGLHPLFLASHRPEHLAALRRWCADHTPVAIGEIGLDLHAPGLDPAQQQHYFHQQLVLASELGLPVIVHARRAVEEVILALRRVPGTRGVVHSFSGSRQQAERLWEMGIHLGMGGPVTYERAQRLRRIVADMPLQYLLLETDAPDQPLAGFQGQRNEPARIGRVLACIAALRGVEPAELAESTHANTCRLFDIEPPPTAP